MIKNKKRVKSVLPDDERHILDDMPLLIGKRIYIQKNTVTIRFYEPHKIDKRAVTGTFMLMTLFGLLLIYPALAQFGEISRSKSWPSVNGTILLSVIPQTTDAGSRKASEVKQFINYRYRVNGDEFIGHKVTLYDGDDRYFVSWMRRHFPKGSPCKVFFDPLDPANAVLVTGFPWTLERRTWIGALCLVTGVLGLIFRRAIFYKAGWEE